MEIFPQGFVNITKTIGDKLLPMKKEGLIKKRKVDKPWKL